METKMSSHLLVFSEFLKGDMIQIKKMIMLAIFLQCSIELPEYILQKDNTIELWRRNRQAVIASGFFSLDVEFWVTASKTRLENY